MNHKPTVILLNPPADAIAIRDNFCSKISQAAYINHPIDLVMQSGFLKDRFHLILIDAVIENLSVSQCLSRIVATRAQYVFSLAGNATWMEDLQFFNTLKNNIPDLTLVVTGDIFLESPADILAANKPLDAIVLDYTNSDLLNYFSGKTDGFSQLVFKNESGDIIDQRSPRESNGTAHVPCPEHSLFQKHNYRYPFVRSQRFATVMTEFGCPFHCSFCVMGTLGCRRRPLPDIMEELDQLNKLGVHDIFFLDQSFGSCQTRNMEMCRLIGERFPSLRWVCFSRVDLVTQEILEAMKVAGCHTIIFGVETASPQLLRKYRKGYSLEQVTRVFEMTAKLGIRTVATFLLGLPGETWDSAMTTIEFAKKLPCNYASLNVAVPRMGTDFRQWAVDQGLVDPDKKQFDQSGSEVMMHTDELTADQLRQLKRIAIKKLYLNPIRVFRMIRSLKSFDEVLIHCREALHLIAGFAGFKL